MSIWIITTGNSDVQLNTKERWTKLFRNVRSQLDDRGFTPTDGTDNRFLAHARVMGTVYSQPSAKEYWGDLVFPLLHNFVGQIYNEAIEQIILILTDQVAVFSPEERRSQHCPYWQDTCSLEPLLTTYLQDKFPQAELKPLLLQPKSPNEGLDDWDSVLTLIQGEFSKLDFPNESTIYVSHQAGTPAISSAVQFEILLRFGQWVKFLVSSERDSTLTKILDRSTYLRGIRKQEAKALLERHDYSGVKELVYSYLKPEVKILLDAAIQWNFAKFEDFAKELLQYPERTDRNFIKEIQEQVQERIKEENWWWTAYEAAYLAVVRLKQGNTVEAMFHSFRALEGLAIKYAKNQGQNLYSRKVFDYFKQQKLEEWNKLLCIKEIVRSEVSRYPKIRNDILDKRNNLFHQLEGFKEEDLYNAWEAKNKPDWENRVLCSLNFISEQSFTSPLEEASLMFKVHQKLEKAITQSVAH